VQLGARELTSQVCSMFSIHSHDSVFTALVSISICIKAIIVSGVLLLVRVTVHSSITARGKTYVQSHNVISMYMSWHSSAETKMVGIVLVISLQVWSFYLF